MSKDMVNHPDHYKTENGLEVIDIIDAITSNMVGKEAVYTAQVLRYVCRWKKKNGLEDLKKARWYLDRLISLVEPIDKIEIPKEMFDYRSFWIKDEDDNK